MRKDLPRIAVHVLSSLPLMGMIVGALTDNLGVNPIEELTHISGESALRLLLLCLAVSPARRLFGWRWVLPLRRPLGLWAFVYAVCHFSIFVGLDYGFDRALLKEGFLEKPFALVGFAALVLMLPLAITSTRWWIRRLKKAWKRLHRLVYVVGVLAVVHLLWLAKGGEDVVEAYVHVGILVALLAARLLPTKRG